MIHRKHFQPALSLRVTVNALVVVFIAVSSASSLTSGGEPSQTRIAQLKQAVVIITTYDSQGKPLLQGSGFFVEADQVVTSLHVIKGASQIRVETFTGTTTTVQSVVAANEETDLALLLIAPACPDSAILRLVSRPPAAGEAVILVSSPQGSRWQITRGNVGPLWTFSGISTRLQITATIAPGSSGGPVVNKQGQVIGIAALYAHSDDALNFVVPAAGLRNLQAQARLAVTIKYR